MNKCCGTCKWSEDDRRKFSHTKYIYECTNASDQKPKCKLCYTDGQDCPLYEAKDGENNEK